MGLFSDCLFGCDIDGTLLVNGIINPRNIEKIEYPKEQKERLSVINSKSYI